MKFYSYLEYQRINNQALKLFERAAAAWVRANAAGDQGYTIRCNIKIKDFQKKAEAILEPLGIKCDYPGLYPCFTFNGYQYLELSQALDAHSQRQIEVLNHYWKGGK